MNDTYDLVPKIPILDYGALIKTKTNIICSKEWEPDAGYEDDSQNQNAPQSPEIEIPENSILFYVKDSQFMAASKVEGKPMSAWIKVQFVTGDKRILWTTILCSPQRIWDFETYRRKKKQIKESFDEMFEIISLGEEKEK